MKAPEVFAAAPRRRSPGSTALAAPAAEAARASDYLALTKPRVVLMVLVTTLVGYYLGAGAAVSPAMLAPLLLGTALAAGGTMTLNQWIERERDARMVRTRERPLPAGRLGAGEALVFGLLLLGAGLGCLVLVTGALAAAVTATIAAVYLLLYTPLKPVTPLAAVIGAVPGALPPVVGWAAARGAIDIEAVVLFAIMFLWQIPHTLAIGYLYRDDYARAGIRVLPVCDPTGPSTGVHAVGHCLALLPVALMPTMLGFAGPIYFLASLLLGIAFLWAAVGMVRLGTLAAARRLLTVSLLYLPALLAVLAFDRVGSLR